jgi:hypothetical protein
MIIFSKGDQPGSVDTFFLLKINRLFSFRDAKLGIANFFFDEFLIFYVIQAAEHKIITVWVNQNWE